MTNGAGPTDSHGLILLINATNQIDKELCSKGAPRERTVICLEVAGQ